MTGRIHRERESHLPLPRIGKVRIGIKAKSERTGNEYPKAVDYFVPTGKYESMVRKVYGEKPQTLQIIFIDDDPALSCCEEYEYRDNKGALFARGDGKTFSVWSEKDSQYVAISIDDMPDVMQKVEEKCPSETGWKVTLTLRFILPKVKGIAGYWEFSTKADASTIPNVRNAFDAVLDNRGFVRGVIFDLNVEMHKSNKPGSKSTYPVVSLVPNHSEENVQAVQGALYDGADKTLLLNE